MDLTAFLDLIKDPSSMLSLFKAALPVTAITYLASLLYLKGIFGNLAAANLPDWDGDIEGWLLAILGTIASLIFALFPQAPYVAFLAGMMFAIFLLLIILWYLVIKLMYHDLPRWLANLLLAAMIIITLLLTALAIWAEVASGGAATPIIIPALLYAAFFAAIYALIITLLYKLIRAFSRWVKKTYAGTLWRKYVLGEPQSVTGGGSSAEGDSSVQNPDGVLPNPDGTEGGGTPSKLPPDSCVIVDFGKKSLADHLGVPDLRVLYAPANANISVEVSNDKQNWETCTRDTSMAAAGGNYDVPYWNSPWRYVRVCNLSSNTINVYDILDLSN